MSSIGEGAKGPFVQPNVNGIIRESNANSSSNPLVEIGQGFLLANNVTAANIGTDDSWRKYVQTVSACSHLTEEFLNKNRIVLTALATAGATSTRGQKKFDKALGTGKSVAEAEQQRDKGDKKTTKYMVKALTNLVNGMPGKTTCSAYHCESSAKLKLVVEAKKCTGCFMVCYCSEACQKKEWAERHKFICKALSEKEFKDNRKSSSSLEKSNELRLLAESSCKALLSFNDRRYYPNFRKFLNYSDNWEQVMIYWLEGLKAINKEPISEHMDNLFNITFAVTENLFSDQKNHNKKFSADEEKAYTDKLNKAFSKYMQISSKKNKAAEEA